MNKADLIKSIAGKTGNKEYICRQMVEAMMDTIGEELNKGDEIVLQGFGSFKPWEQTSRTGRNPRTGAACPIEPRTSVKFKAGKGLLQRLNK